MGGLATLARGCRPAAAVGQAEQVGKAQQRFFQHRQVEPVGDAGAGLGGGHQLGITQHLEVGGQGGLAQGEAVGQFTGRHVTLAQQLQDAAPRRVAQGFEDLVHFRNFANHRINVKPSRQTMRRHMKKARPRSTP